MRETRVIVDAHGVTPLMAGVDYDLPKEFATYLVLGKKATYYPGRLKKRNPRQIKAPNRNQPRSAGHVIMALFKKQKEEYLKAEAEKKKADAEQRVILLDD